nr:hypothetical protein CFP56_33032 [Quercus suber]
MELEASIIKKIPFCLSPQSDVLTWPHNSVGEYSLKFGYRFLQEESLKQQPGPSNFVALRPLWQAIWKLDISCKEQPAIGKTIVTAGKNSAGCKGSCSGIPKRPHSHGCSLSPPSSRWLYPSQLLKERH